MRFLSYVPNYLFGAYIALRWKNIVLEIEPNFYVRILALIAFIFPFFKLDLGPVSYLLIQFYYVFLWMLIPTTWFTKELPKFFKYSFMIYAIHGGLYWKFAFFFDDHNLFYYAIRGCEYHFNLLCFRFKTVNRMRKFMLLLINLLYVKKIYSKDL